VTVRATANDTSASQGRNALPGIVTDASFTGLSTQYLVRTAWGQELQVFSQNLSADDVVRLGDDVVVSWDPIHSFCLDGSEDLKAGVDKDLLALGTLGDGSSVTVGG
jgi:spermidine/putrescine transport system ATP-binding protein